MSKDKDGVVRRGLLATLPAIAFLAVSTVAATRPLPNAGGEAALAANAWAAANRTALPTSYSDFAALPFAYRKATLVELTLPQRKELWREHMKLFLTPVDSLTPQLKSIVQGLDSVMTDRKRDFIRAEIDSLEGTFDPSLSTEQRARKSSGVCARASAFFTRHDAALLFFYIGGFDSSFLLPMSADQVPLRINSAGLAWNAASTLRFVAGKIGLGARMAPVCFCAQNATACECTDLNGGNEAYCVQSWPPCENHGIYASCGCQHNEVCDGGKCAAG